LPVRSLEDPRLEYARVLNDTFREPTKEAYWCSRYELAEYVNSQFNFLFSTFDGVGTMADITTNSETEIATNRT
jgi:hypothetical protein